MQKFSQNTILQKKLISKTMRTCFVCKMERGQSGKTNAKCFILLKPKRLASIAYIQISLKKNEGSKWPQNNELRITSANRDLLS